MLLSVSCTQSLADEFGGNEALFRAFKRHGIDAVDFSIDAPFASTVERVCASPLYGLDEDGVKEYVKPMLRAMERTGMIVGQTHAMFGSYAAVNTPEYRKLMISEIIATHELGASHVVIHPLAIPGRIHTEKKEEGFEYNVNMFRSFIPPLQKYGVKIGIEPMWIDDAEGNICATVCSDPHEIVEMIDELGHECFCACPDIGHFDLTAWDTGISTADALRVLGKTVEIVHVHETRKNDDSHAIPYSVGNMDWPAILAAFREIGYSGTFNYELSMHHYLTYYPATLFDEPLRHISVIGHDMIDKITK